MKIYRIQGLFSSLACLLALLLAAPSVSAQESDSRTEPWSAETVQLFASLPVQDGGRIKPLEKLAGLHLLTFNGKRNLEIESGERLGPAEWLLDCFFFPEQAKTYECFRINNDSVLTGIGIDVAENDKRKSDRYSYNELLPYRRALDDAAMQASEVEAAQQSPTQSQTLKLAHDLRKFDALINLLEPLRWKYSTTGSPELDELFGRESSTLSEVLVGAPQLTVLANSDIDQGSPEFEALQRLFAQLDSAMEWAGGSAALMPPPSGTEDPLSWWPFSDVLGNSFQSKVDTAPQRAILSSWEQLEAAKGDPVAFQGVLTTVHASTVALAEVRGEYKQIPLEMQLEKLDPFTLSLAAYLLGFLVLAFSWLMPAIKFLPRAIWSLVLIGLGLAITGIVMRCIIRSRPPVVSLYDTVLFVTSVAVLAGLLTEWLTRRRVGLAVSVILGVGGMFLAGKYELKEINSAGDTMASVVAVLDTNYYLAIHVTTITMGYAGGLLAAAIGHVWILGKLFGLKRGDTQFYKTITRMTYGAVCFSLLFALFGTIMGGVWANDSWGRFWGWDPKENGALLIVIWQLLTLHMRMGGFTKDRGFATMAVVGGGVVSASWWGVNLLNVGLHSYGFTSGVAKALFSHWGVALLMVLLAGLGAFLGRGGSSKTA